MIAVIGVRLEILKKYCLFNQKIILNLFLYLNIKIIGISPNPRENIMRKNILNSESS